MRPLVYGAWIDFEFTWTEPRTMQEAEDRIRTLLMTLTDIRLHSVRDLGVSLSEEDAEEVKHGRKG